MSIKSLNPYLNFDGTADKAIQLYQRALGARVDNLMRWSQAPGECAPEHADRIMHSEVHVGDALFMVADGMPGKPLTIGTNVHVCLHFDDPADMAARFDALAAGGKVTMPLADTFWGATYGELTDTFGVHWLFNCMKQG